MKFDDLEIIDLNAEDETANQEEAQEKRVDLKHEIKSFVISLMFMLAIVFALKNYVIINAKVPTGSMENTIMPGDNLLGFRLAYLTEDPQRGDVVFFYFPDDESQRFVKRIIGLPGEKVSIVDGKIYINDSSIPIEEPYLKETWTKGTGPYVFEVPEGCYLCLGDNRNRSADAREWNNPYVTKEKIIGKALFTYFPFDHMGVIE